MSTRYDELTKILGTDSAGTPSPIPAEEEQKQTSRRDELFSMLGASEPETPATAGTGASTTQNSLVLEKPKQETLQQTTPQSAAPTAPLMQGILAGNRSAEQIQQEISDSRKRLAQLQSDAAYVLTAEPGAELGRQMDAERARIKALNEELDALKTPNTNAERDSLIQRMNAITENEGYAATVEQADAVQQEKQDTRQRLHQLDEELGNAARFYDSGERSGAVIKGALKQTGSAYTNFMGTLQGVGNRLHEASSAADQAVAGSDYAGWATDEMTAANMAAAAMKENPDGNYLEGLQKEEQRLYEKADTMTASAAKDIEQAKEGLSALGQAGVDISTNLIQMGIDAAGRAAGLGMLPFFVRAAGGSMQEARHDGASTGQQFAYGLTKGAIEVGTEKLFDGLAGIFGKGAADDVIEGLIGKLSGSNTGRSLLRAFAGATGEGTEEVISDLLDPFAKLIYNDQALAEAWENREELRSQMLYDYLLGVAMGGFGSVIGAATGQYAEKNAALAEMGGESQTAETATAEATTQSAAPTAPLTQGSQTPQSTTATAPIAGEPLRAATQGRPYSQPGQGAELNTQQEAQAQAAETAQNVQRAAPQAETPPTTQNAAQTASGELNLRDEGNVSSSDYDTQRQESLMFSEAPQEAVHNTDSFDAVTANNDFQNRDFNDVGNQKIKAYMYENPEVKPFFQFEAEAMLNDLKNSVKGERFYNSQLAYDSGNEYGWTGNKRLVSDDIAVLLDYGYSYEEIEKGLKAIIEDDGRENNACSKRIEFLLNDRLMDGYTDWQSNEFVPPNQEYRNMILEKQINAYSKEAFEEYLKNAERYAPKDAKINSNGQSNPQGADTVRGFSKNVATDSAMEAELRREFEQNPEMYTRLANKDTLKKAQDIFAQGLDKARSELERAIGAAQSGQKFPLEMVPLSRMVANELTRQGELTAARKIISDVAAELTSAGQLGQAGAILRNADPITVLNTLQKTLDSINKEVSGKQGTSRNRKAADSTGAELENAVKDAAGKLAENEEIRNAVKREIDRSRSGKGKGGEKQEASVAEILRDALKRDAFSRIKPKTTDPQKELVKSLKRFAMEKLPPKQGTRQKTATDVLSDYVKNQEMFTEAWEDAQQMLREDAEVTGNPIIEEILGGFVNEGINVNANYPAEIRARIMAKALTEEALNTGETKQTIRNQYALGVSVKEIGGRIADSLIRQTGASGEIAETIRDAATEYADRIISEDTKDAEARANSIVNSAVLSVGETMRSLAKQGQTSKAAIKRAVADVLAFEYAVDPKTAERISETVYELYDAQLKENMDAEVQRRYGEKEPGRKKPLNESISETINIGAFESEYAEKAADQLTKKAIKELGTTVEKIALGNSAKKTGIRDAVVSLFVSNYGLSQEQAFEIADLVTSQFDNMVGQAADRIIERRFGAKPNRDTQKTDTVQKLIEAVNIGAFNSAYASEAANKLFGLDKIKAGNWKAELTAEEIKQISETDFSQDGAYEAIQQQIAVRLGREMPATWAEKLREIRKVGMLANPKTQVKNVLGNAPLAVERKVSERLSGGLQELAVKAGIMSKEEQTRTLRVSQESKDLAKSVYKNNIDRITRKGNKGELRGLLKDTRTYFNKGLLQKGIEKATGHQLNDAALDYVRRFTYECLEKGDAPFVKSAFIDSLAQYCEAQGIKSEADVTDTAFSYALDQAMAATFKDASALANLLNSIKDKAGIAGQALDVLFPFTTTPINIAKEFGKYSPLGYLQLLNAKGKGTAEVIDIISRATTGSAVVAIGAILRSLGFITGAADDDKDKAAADKAAGISPYSFGGKYSYEWMQPTGSALAMGASIYDAAKDGGTLIETISNGIISAGDAYLEQSFYKDIIDLFQGYGSPTENMIRELLTGTASQFIPTIVGATARTIDPTVRTSYSGGNIIDDILAQAKVKTPGISKSAPASVNVRGEEIQRGNLAQRILDNFIFPWTTNRNGETANAMDKALDEVYEATGDKTIFRQVSPYKVDYGGESYQMTGEEREQFQKTQGQVHDDILQQIIAGALWKEMDNDAKVKTMQLANEYALDAAKRELVESRGDEYSSDWDDEAELTDVGDYLAAKTTLKAAQDSKDYALLDALVDNVTEQKKDVQEKLNKDFSMLDELIYGKQRGVEAETIYTAKTEADANGNGKISQEELWYYLGLQKNMPEETKDVLWDILTTGKTGYSEYAEKQK